MFKKEESWLFQGVSFLARYMLELSNELAKQGLVIRVQYLNDGTRDYLVLIGRTLSALRFALAT